MLIRRLGDDPRDPRSRFFLALMALSDLVAELIFTVSETHDAGRHLFEKVEQIVELHWRDLAKYEADRKVH